MGYCNKFINTDIKFSKEDTEALNNFYEEVNKIDEVYFPKLMEFEEVIQTRQIIDEFLEECVENFNRGELIPLFRQDNTLDYIMYYNSGKNKGCAFYLSHKLIIIAPVFKSLKEVSEYLLDKREKFEFDYYGDFIDRFKAIGIEIDQ